MGIKAEVKLKRQGVGSKKKGSFLQQFDAGEPEGKARQACRINKVVPVY